MLQIIDLQNVSRSVSCRCVYLRDSTESRSFTCFTQQIPDYEVECGYFAVHVVFVLLCGFMTNAAPVSLFPSRQKITIIDSKCKSRTKQVKKKYLLAKGHLRHALDSWELTRHICSNSPNTCKDIKHLRSTEGQNIHLSAGFCRVAPRFVLWSLITAISFHVNGDFFKKELFTEGFRQHFYLYSDTRHFGKYLVRTE